MLFTLMLADHKALNAIFDVFFQSGLNFEQTLAYKRKRYFK